MTDSGNGLTNASQPRELHHFPEGLYTQTVSKPTLEYLQMAGTQLVK